MGLEGEIALALSHLSEAVQFEIADRRRKSSQESNRHEGLADIDRRSGAGTCSYQARQPCRSLAILGQKCRACSLFTLGPRCYSALWPATSSRDTKRALRYCRSPYDPTDGEAECVASSLPQPPLPLLHVRLIGLRPLTEYPTSMLPEIAARTWQVSALAPDSRPARKTKQMPRTSWTHAGVNLARRTSTLASARARLEAIRAMSSF